MTISHSPERMTSPSTPVRSARLTAVPEAPIKAARPVTSDYDMVNLIYKLSSHDKDEEDIEGDEEKKGAGSLSEFITSETTVEMVSNYLKNYRHRKSQEDLESEIDDLIDEAYFSSRVSGDVAVYFIQYGCQHFDWQPNWQKLAQKKKVNDIVRQYAQSKVQK